MSGNRTSEGKHKRHGSWRSSPLLSRVSERFGSLRDKVPRPKNSFKKPSPTPVQPDTAYPKPSKPSFAECSAAVLAALDENYFTQDFDPLTHELSQLPNSVGQEELDVVVDKLASALEVVSAQLSTHVLENHDRFVEGINTVASVESDLQIAHIITCNARINLRFALEEVKTNMKITKQTQQKQGYMSILEYMCKLQQTQRLIRSHQDAQESGDYAEAIVRCAECFDHLETLGNLVVGLDLKKSVHNMYKETIVRMETALLSVCNDFRPDEYRRVLEGFMFQDITNQEFSEKVLSGFKDSIINNSNKVVRSVIVTKANLAEDLLSSRGAMNFNEMCQSLPFDLFCLCLAKLLEVLFDVMTSYHAMADWHEEILKSMAAETTMERKEDPSSEDQRCGNSSKAVEDEDTMINILGCVHDLLGNSRKVIWDLAARRVRDLLSGPAAFEGEHFLQVMEWCQRFLSAGEAFVQEQSEFLRSTIGNQCGKFFETYHQTNLEALEILLASEQFVNVGSHLDGRKSQASGPKTQATSNTATMHLRDILNSPGMFDASAHDDVDSGDFDAWLERGNPFRPEEASRKRQKKTVNKYSIKLGFGGATNMGEDQASRRLDVDEHGLAHGDNVWSRLSSESFPSFSLSRKETGEEEDEDDEEEEENEDLFGEIIDEETQMVRWGDSVSQPGETSDDSTAVLTNCGHQILKWTRNYGSLMKPLVSRSEDIFQGICGLFDAYVLHAFLFLSDMSLESLVWEEDVMTTRLRSTIFRIMRQHDKFKEEIQRIQSSKPTNRPSNGQQEGKFTKDFKNFFSKDKTAAAALNSLNGTGPGTTPTAEAFSSKQVWTSRREQLAIKSSENMYGLRETAVAVASVATLAKELSDSKSAFQSLLPSTLSTMLDNYYRTVDAMEDLKEFAFRNSTRRILHEVLDVEKGVANQIASTAYDREDMSVTHNSWAQRFGENLSAYSDLLCDSSLPADDVAQMWEQAIGLAAELLLDGFSRVQRCSILGRSMMSLDLTYVENLFKAYVPEDVPVNLRVVDTYIKAFYLPWEELPGWAETHMMEYRQDRIEALVEHVAQRTKALEGREIKRSDIRRMKNDIEGRTKELLG